MKRNALVFIALLVFPLAHHGASCSYPSAGEIADLIYKKLCAHPSYGENWGVCLNIGDDSYYKQTEGFFSIVQEGNYSVFSFNVDSTAQFPCPQGDACSPPAAYALIAVADSLCRKGNPFSARIAGEILGKLNHLADNQCQPHRLLIHDTAVAHHFFHTALRCWLQGGKLLLSSLFEYVPDSTSIGLMRQILHAKGLPEPAIACAVAAYQGDRQAQSIDTAGLQRRSRHYRWMFDGNARYVAGASTGSRRERRLDKKAAEIFDSLCYQDPLFSDMLDIHQQGWQGWLDSCRQAYAQAYRKKRLDIAQQLRKEGTYSPEALVRFAGICQIHALRGDVEQFHTERPCEKSLLALVAFDREKHLPQARQ